MIFETLVGEKIELSAIPAHDQLLAFDLIALQYEVTTSHNHGKAGEFLQKGWGVLRRHHPLPWRLERVLQGPIGEVFLGLFYKAWIDDWLDLLKSKFSQPFSEKGVRECFVRHLRHSLARPVCDSFILSGGFGFAGAELSPRSPFNESSIDLHRFIHRSQNPEAVIKILKSVLPWFADIHPDEGDVAQAVNRMLCKSRPRVNLSTLQNVYESMKITTTVCAPLVDKSVPSAQEVALSRAISVVLEIQAVEKRWKTLAPTKPPFWVLIVDDSNPKEVWNRKLLLKHFLAAGCEGWNPEFGEKVQWRPLLLLTRNLASRVAETLSIDVNSLLPLPPNNQSDRLGPGHLRLSEELEDKLSDVVETFNLYSNFSTTGTVAELVLCLQLGLLYDITNQVVLHEVSTVTWNEIKT